MTKEQLKSAIFSIITKLDNGSHSSSQLQGVDEALLELLLSYHAKEIEDLIEKIKKMPFIWIDETPEKKFHFWKDDALVILAKRLEK